MPIRPRRRSPALLAASALLACSAAATASASEHARTEAVWVRAAAPVAAAGGQAIPALLDVPPGWTAGDAAAVILSDGPWPALARERLVAALLEEGAAVLEFDPGTARVLARTGPLPAAADLVADVRGAVETLQRDAAAGLVVALGRGTGGNAAVLAAAAARAEPAGDGLAAGASLGPGPATFALGGVPPEGELGVHRGWPVRAKRLCAVLAAAALPSESRAETECRRALVGPGETRPVRVAGP